MVSLVATRLSGESWRDAVRRIGHRHGLQFEVLECFDSAIRLGDSPREAAGYALSEWDCWDLEDDDD